MKIDYEHIKRENEAFLSENLRIKDELIEYKKSMNEYVFDIQQIRIENENFKRVKDALAKENENNLKIIEDILKENRSLKENLIENNAFEIKFNKDTAVAELEKILQLSQERVKHVEDQNKLLTKTYNEHLDEIMNSRSNIAKDAATLLLQNFHNSLNKYLDKENNPQLESSIIASLSPSKSFLNAAINDIRKNVQPGMNEIPRNSFLSPEVYFINFIVNNFKIRFPDLALESLKRSLWHLYQLLFQMKKQNHLGKHLLILQDIAQK